MKKLLLVFFALLINNTLLSQTPMFVEVAGGAFTMGSNSGKKNQQPEHLVKLSDFSISETPITVAQYRMFCKQTGREMPEAPEWGWKNNYPIVNVNWRNAINYCNWLSKVLNKNVKLPTEAQWEYAARGGENEDKFKHSGGKKIAKLGWCRVQKVTSTQPVATKTPNSLGIYDMNGNVWEWCMDWYDSNFYANSPEQDPENTSFGNKKCRVTRGGGWDSDALTCTVSQRKEYIPKSSFNDRGFRVVILN